MKKIMFFILIFTLCLTVSVFAESFSVVVDNKTANAGDTVDINVCLESNSGIIAALFDVEYDRERLELIEVQDGQLLQGGTFSPDYKFYPYKMVWNSAAYTNYTDDGVLAVLKFKVLENAQPGKAFVNLAYNENDVFDVDLNNVPITVINGGIEIAGNTSAGDTVTNGSSVTYRPSGISSASKPANDNADKEEKTKEQIILTIGEKEALVFGEIKVNDVAPLIKNDRTMLPARFVAENLGADVKWDNDTSTVTITKDDIAIIITIDSKTAFVNGTAIVLDSPAFIENDRTYTPLRFIAEKLGADVEWDGTTQKVIITK